MNLVFIYGPPAVGKLTVARELSKLTDYKILHNTLAISLICSIFDYGSDTFYRLNSKFRIDLITAAAKDDVPGLIFTFCYIKPKDDKFIKKVIDIIQRFHGKVYFVKLKCEPPILFKRIKSKSRNKYNKLTTISALKKLLKKYNLFSSISFGKSLSMDNTQASAKKVALKIKDFYHL